ncbi:WASH complex subunit 1-like [Artemia franciscana]|uniref:WASH1 WAHD domain-containing protein n=1 Tax=Artemia franciscana TaxID=6661 RepID=A0AA88I1J7_ARTSF|nr:hypothetical protein QYM36_005643 [Artemia franciscana]KAK2718403.1 hypothetical protein QYM36_005643 [Artemia franciscana]KAK2718404.1 hypothetical protein QYM36_005643 [Artemia franciscana]
MDKVSSQITLVPLNLRPEETLVQIQKSLKTLMSVSAAVSGEMNKRIQEVQTRVSHISKRVDSAQTVVNHLLTINNKAIKIFSSASYPVEQNDPFGFTTLNHVVKSYPAEEERYVIRKPYSPVDEKRLREKLNFYHVDVGERQNDPSVRNNKNNEFRSISQLLFYLSSKTRFSKDSLDHSDMVTSLDWRSSEKELNASAPLLGDAPPSIKRRGGLRKIQAGNLYYQPQVTIAMFLSVSFKIPPPPFQRFDLET